MSDPHIPPARNVAPRCPLCGIILDIDVDIDTRAAARLGIITLAPKAQAHVITPHTIDYPADVTL
jgi:hypothetical protein